MSFFFLLLRTLCFFFFFFNDTATTEIYTLSLHDALPISPAADAARRQTRGVLRPVRPGAGFGGECAGQPARRDRKSTRLNSSHGYISYAVFCLKKKKKTSTTHAHRTRCASRCRRASHPTH